MKDLLFFFAFLTLLGCKNDTTKSYSFFVAGHTYGSPVENPGGLHPPFVNCFSELVKDNSLKMGFFTGDIVQKSTVENWKLVQRDLEELNDLNLQFIAGNHDLRGNDIFRTHFSNPYSFFEYRHDAFILLDGNIDHWNIAGDQLIFLEKTLSELGDEVNNIFIFTHQLIFAEMLGITPNSWEGKADILTFESDVMPLLKATGRSVYLFSGDVGAMSWGKAFSYEKVNNVTFLASGMGGGNGDNFLMVNVLEDQSVKIEIVPLDDKTWGEISEY